MGGYDLSFLWPNILWFLLALPLFLWVLRYLPPQIKEVAFPGMLLLKNEKTTPPPQTPPWWLLLLRLALITSIILALSTPTLSPKGDAVPKEPSLLIWVDNTWPSAQNWESIKNKLQEVITTAHAQQQKVLVVPMAQSQISPPKTIQTYQEAQLALKYSKTLSPQPWPIDERALTQLQQNTNGTKLIWLSSGVYPQGKAKAINQILRTFPTVEVHTPAGHNLPIVLTGKTHTEKGLRIKINRLHPQSQAHTLLLKTGGSTAIKVPLDFKNTLQTEVNLPLETSIEAPAILTIEGQKHLGAHALIPPQPRRNIGVITTGESTFPLLIGGDYIQKAITQHNTARLKPNSPYNALDLIFLTTHPQQPKKLLKWVQQGGVLISFAGPWLTGNSAAHTLTTPLLPMPLRPEPRTLSGPLSWKNTLGLGAAAPHGPLRNLQLEDIQVKKQFLPANPTLEEDVWLTLEDNTPLVSAKKEGNGWKVLVHTSAVPDWSDLPASGFFVRLIEKLITLSHKGLAHTAIPTPPYKLMQVLTHTGQLHPPQTEAYIHKKNTAVSIQAPSGVYSHGILHQLNTTERMRPPITPIHSPVGKKIKTYTYGNQNSPMHKPLTPFFWLLAFILFLIDSALYTYRQKTRTVLPLLPLFVPLFLCVLSSVMYAPISAYAQTVPEGASEGVRKKVPKGAHQTQIAWVDTHNPSLNTLTKQALEGLSLITQARTTLRLAPPQKTNLTEGELGLYTLIFWPITPSTPPLTDTQKTKLLGYIRNGGTVLIDSLTENGNGKSALKNILNKNLPLPLRLVRKKHVLNRSYYLLRGHFAGKEVNPLWVETRHTLGRVFIGHHDWASAWALTPEGTPIRRIRSSHQQAKAFQFGINMVMYALLGDYKADQAHIGSTLKNITPLNGSQTPLINTLPAKQPHKESTHE